MSSLKPVSWKNLVKRLKRMGFNGPYAGGKHLFLIKGELTLTLPNPHGKDIGIGLLSKILKQAGISKKAWDKSQ